LQGRSPGDHKRRWGSLRLYLCGDEACAATADQEEDEEEEDDNGTVVSAGSFETCPTTRIPAADRGADVKGASDSSDPEVLQNGVHGNGVLATPVGEEEAATLIQSAFRTFMVCCRSISNSRLPRGNPIAHANPSMRCACRRGGGCCRRC
jgi:hypothetical protein